jgi:hypothetical protein
LAVGVLFTPIRVITTITVRIAIDPMVEHSRTQASGKVMGNPAGG